MNGEREIEDVAERIRRMFGETAEDRADFLADPGGIIAYCDMTDSDEVALAAIRIIQGEWADAQ